MARHPSATDDLTAACPAGGRGGSRPKPPKAGARSARLDAPRPTADHHAADRTLTNKTVAPFSDWKKRRDPGSSLPGFLCPETLKCDCPAAQTVDRCADHRRAVPMPPAGQGSGVFETRRAGVPTPRRHPVMVRTVARRLPRGFGPGPGAATAQASVHTLDAPSPGP